MMTTEKARALLDQVGQLVALASRFQAMFGRSYRVDPSVGPGGLELYEAIVRVQAAIARMLDAPAVENPHTVYGEWWQRQDVPDNGITHALMSHVSHLITACAFVESNNVDEGGQVILAAQRAIAGMIHPAVLHHDPSEQLILHIG